MRSKETEPEQQSLFHNTAWMPDTPVPGMRYLERCMSSVDCGKLMQWLVGHIAWRQESMIMFGKKVSTPRLVAWCGNANLRYRYSGVQHVCEGWISELLPVQRMLEKLLGVRFNFVLLNYYRDGRDSMGWHSDNEKELGQEPLIASLSLGAPRRFLVRPVRRQANRQFEPDNAVVRKSRALQLGSGSLLVMQGQSQNRFEHSLPGSAKVLCGRINLTFRYVLRSQSDVQAVAENSPGIRVPLT